MSGLIHPVGPQNPRVYWVRRGLLFGAIFMTIVLIYSLLTGGSEQPSGQASPIALPSQTNMPSSPSTTDSLNTATPSSTPSQTTTQTPSIQPLTDCLDEQIAVSVSINPSAPTVGQNVKVTMSIANTSSTACNRDVGSGANEITIISGPALIWSSDHCNTSTQTDVRTMQPGQKISITATWDSIQTSENCTKYNQATSGTYWAHAKNLSKNSDGLRFVISN